MDEFRHHLRDASGAEVVILSSPKDGNEVPGKFFAIGRCMAPLIQPGDHLVTEPIGRALDEGAVVVYEARGKLLAHRVVRVEGDQFWARGDSSGVTDGPCAISSIRGRAVAVERGLRRLALPRGRVALARGRLLAGLRDLAARFPGLRRQVEVRLLGGAAARRVGRVVGALLLGPVRIEAETDPSRAFAELLGTVTGASPAYLEELERIHRDGALVVLRAISERHSEVGRVLLLPLPGVRAESVALVHALAVDLGFRGTGIGASLLDRSIEEAERRCWRTVFARVAAGNERSLGLFRSRGFFEAAPWERPLGMKAEDHWLVKRLTG